MIKKPRKCFPLITLGKVRHSEVNVKSVIKRVTPFLLVVAYDTAFRAGRSCRALRVLSPRFSSHRRPLESGSSAYQTLSRPPSVYPISPNRSQGTIGETCCTPFQKARRPPFPVVRAWLYPFRIGVQFFCGLTKTSAGA